MAQIAILQRKCTGCGLCQSNCPFGAIDMTEQGPRAQCRLQGMRHLRQELSSKGHRSAGNQVCFRGQKRLERISSCLPSSAATRLHPVSLELIGKARTLAKAVPGFKVRAVLVGNGVSACAEELRHYGVAEIAVYDDPALGYFRADAYAACVEDYIRSCRPSVVLVGATALGRSLAPRIATRFHTGLTAVAQCWN